MPVYEAQQSANCEDGLRWRVRAGIGDRFVRLVKANVNEMLNKAEDPEKMLNQIVEDMQVGACVAKRVQTSARPKACIVPARPLRP